ncbi:unnamed protein product [Meganyctiphanes norvegica]|uniref:Gustatory receptor n=1 Tax=Meganyctiphanes norvegica TaxID=48144 RepID=A0AAV2RPZ4_MEGNR
MSDSEIAIDMSTKMHTMHVQETNNTEHKKGIANPNFIKEDDDNSDVVLYETHDTNQFVKKFPFAWLLIYDLVLNVSWNAKRNEYVSHSFKFMYAYTAWFLTPVIVLNLAPFIFKELDINDSIFNPVFSMLCIVVPALQVYTLHIIHLHAKSILEFMDKLPAPKRYEGKVFIKTFKRFFIGTKKIESFVSILPRIILMLALLWWAATVIYNFIMYQIQLIGDITVKEWWYFIITFVYALLPMFTLRFIFCITVWMSELYKDMYQAYEKKLTKKEAKDLAKEYSVVVLQSLFNEIREITRYGISINFTVIFFCALYSTINIIGNNGSLLYLIPFTGTMLPLTLFCRSAGMLVDRYEKLIYTIKKKILEEQELSQVLQKQISFLELAEPRLFVLGGYHVGFSLTFTVIGFIFTYSSLLQDPIISSVTAEP